MDSGNLERLSTTEAQRIYTELRNLTPYGVFYYTHLTEKYSIGVSTIYSKGRKTRENLFGAVMPQVEIQV